MLLKIQRPTNFLKRPNLFFGLEKAKPGNSGLTSHAPPQPTSGGSVERLKTVPTRRRSVEGWWRIRFSFRQITNYDKSSASCARAPGGLPNQPKASRDREVYFIKSPFITDRHVRTNSQNDKYISVVRLSAAAASLAGQRLLNVFTSRVEKGPRRVDLLRSKRAASGPQERSICKCVLSFMNKTAALSQRSIIIRPLIKIMLCLHT